MRSKQLNSTQKATIAKCKDDYTVSEMAEMVGSSYFQVRKYVGELNKQEKQVPAELEESPKIQRPPAVYSNRRSLYQ